MDILTQANDHAQHAWTRVREHHTATGHWHPRLSKEYGEAEQMVRDIEAIYAMSESQLDALFDATMADLDDLAAAEGLPDIPLALAWKPGEYVAGWGK